MKNKDDLLFERMTVADDVFKSFNWHDVVKTKESWEENVFKDSLFCKVIFENEPEGVFFVNFKNKKSLEVLCFDFDEIEE